MNLLSKSAVGALALVALSGCYYYPDRYYDDRYGYAYGPGYDAYYDGYYGPYNGGYWGDDGDFFYYDSDRRYHRDYEHHFRHQAFEGARGYRAGRYEHDRDRDDYRP